MVAQAVKANRSLFENKGIALSLEASDANARVLGDRDKIVQVLTNLLSNAAKFTPTGGKAWVRTFHQPGQAIVEVEDTEIGIPADQVEAIFERFRQVGDTLATKREGAGLGLPISREIVQSHSGSLTVRRSSDQGTCFRMTAV